MKRNSFPPSASVQRNGRKEGRDRFRSERRREGERPPFRFRTAEDGKEFTRERKREFNRDEPKRFPHRDRDYDRESPRRFSREDKEDRRAQTPKFMRYIHRRRKPEEEI